MVGFKTFFFVFGFQKINYDVSFFELPFVGFTQVKSIGLCLCQIWGAFSYFFLPQDFSVLPSFSFQDSSDTNVRSSVIV